jgi:hypothetical protein
MQSTKSGIDEERLEKSLETGANSFWSPPLLKCCADDSLLLGHDFGMLMILENEDSILSIPVL